ncbi:MAG: SGNH/GDSL hydrolase family protein [Dehalococcoidia bacterium]
MRGPISLITLSAFVTLGVAAMLATGASAQTSPTATDPTVVQTPPPTVTAVPSVSPPAIAPYFSLGDSIADAEGASSQGLGYVSLFATKAWPLLGFSGTPSDRGDYGLRGGETSTTMMAAGGQLDRATAEISRRNSDADTANDVRLITIDIGGNDFRALTRTGSPCLANVLGPACQAAVADVTNTFNTNYPIILQRVRAAAGSKATIIAMAFYNPFSGTGQAVDAPGDIVVGQLAAQAKAAATSSAVNAIWVDLAPLFQGKAPQLTHIAESNIHPNDHGHAVIAEAVYQALKTAITPPVAPSVGTGAAGPDHGISIVFVLGLVLTAAGAGLTVAARRAD